MTNIKSDENEKLQTRNWILKEVTLVCGYERRHVYNFYYFNTLELVCFLAFSISLILFVSIEAMNDEHRLFADIHLVFSVLIAKQKNKLYHF